MLSSPCSVIQCFRAVETATRAPPPAIRRSSSLTAHLSLVPDLFLRHQPLIAFSM